MLDNFLGQLFEQISAFLESIFGLIEDFLSGLFGEGGGEA